MKSSQSPVIIRCGAAGKSNAAAKRHGRKLAAVLLAVLLPRPNPAWAGSLVPKGRPAPDLKLTTLEGRVVTLADLRGRIVLLLFGELYNKNTVAACRDISAVLASPPVSDPEIDAFMAVTQEAPTADLADEARRAGVTVPILHDSGRRTFAAYEVMVLPSLVVIDPQGVVAMPCAGYPMDFPALVSDAILLAGGSLSAGEFERRRTPTTAPGGSETHARAVRLASLGEELAKRGSEELAIGKFQEALALDPDCLPARIGLGHCLLARGDLAQAEAQFQHVLGASPDSVEGGVGLIRVQIIRGGSELRSAEERLHALLLKHPNDPKVVYLAGVVAEKSGDSGAALGRYKKAAELLLYGPEPKRELK
jgi:peroxiredoxin